VAVPANTSSPSISTAPCRPRNCPWSGRATTPSKPPVWRERAVRAPQKSMSSYLEPLKLRAGRRAWRGTLRHFNKYATVTVLRLRLNRVALRRRSIVSRTADAGEPSEHDGRAEESRRARPGARERAGTVMNRRSPSDALGKPVATCGPDEHKRRLPPEKTFSEDAFSRAAALFRVAGDVARLKLLDRLADGEWCVTELADAAGVGLSTVSQQLRILRAERIVERRRSGSTRSTRSPIVMSSISSPMPSITHRKPTTRPAKRRSTEAGASQGQGSRRGVNVPRPLGTSRR
jgi:DNA-binding transcriptional ArsR family regulator